MKSFIFLTGQYMPNPGATGVCVHYIAKELHNRGHKVSVVCFDDGFSGNSFDGIKIIKVSLPSYLYSMKKQHVFLSRIYKLLNVFFYPLRSRKVWNKYTKATLDAVAGERINDVVVMATYSPLEAAASLIRIKKAVPQVKTVFYSSDTLSNEDGSGLLPRSFRRKKGFLWEKKIFESSDAAFIMECHMNYYLSDKFKQYHPIFNVVSFPLLVNNQITDANEKVSNLVVYAGTLYRQLRNPRFACDTLLSVRNYWDIDAVFMGAGDCDDILMGVEKQSDSHIKYLGMQPHDAAKEYIMKASVLLSIGNKESPMMPSKIYEYIATGKPIIHFYSWDKDPCIEPLLKYGNALVIKEGESNSVEQIVGFLKTAKTIDYESVKDIFLTATPCYTANMLEKVKIYNRLANTKY